MPDTVSVRCGSCGAGFRVAPSNLGRKARCKSCQAVMLLEPVPEVRSSPSIGGAARSSTPKKPFVWSEQSLLYKASGVALLVVFAAVMGWLKWNSLNRADQAARRLGERLIETPEPAAPTPPLTPSLQPLAPRPQPKTLGPAPTLQFTNTADHRLGTATVTARHARRTEVRLFLPPGSHADGSLPCVFVCPAGSNLLVGVPFDPSEHQDFLPLLKRGLAVCFYTLDGTVKDLRNTHPPIMSAAMQQFADADCGLANLSDAIDTVLANSKSIDPTRLATCGHSSAGTVAIAALAHEDRIATAAVMAPAIDVPKRLGEEVTDALSAPVTQAMYRNTPSNIEHLEKALFIYETKDDQNTSPADAVAFAQKRGATVTLKLGETGGHSGAYRDGLGPCFAFLAKTLNAHANAETMTSKASETPTRSSPPTAPF